LTEDVKNPHAGGSLISGVKFQDAQRLIERLKKASIGVSKLDSGWDSASRTLLKSALSQYQEDLEIAKKNYSIKLTKAKPVFKLFDKKIERLKQALQDDSFNVP
jgi:transposase